MLRPFLVLTLLLTASVLMPFPEGRAAGVAPRTADGAPAPGIEAMEKIADLALVPPKLNKGAPLTHAFLIISQVSFWKLTPLESHDFPINPNS